MKKRLLLVATAIACLLACALLLVACFPISSSGGGENNGGSGGGTNNGGSEEKVSVSGIYLLLTRENELDESDHFVFENGRWTDSDEISGPFEINGNNITLYFDIDGEKVEYISGEISKSSGNDDIYFKSTRSTYRKSDLTAKPKTFTYELSEDKTHYIVTGVGGMEGEIEIPELHKGLPVTEIADGAFGSNKTLTKITVPESVTAIGQLAFANCAQLKEVDIRGEITEFASKTFYFSLKLETVRIPESAVKFAKDAFGMCENLKNIYYGGSASDWAQIDFAAYSPGGETMGIVDCNPLGNKNAKLFINGELVEDIDIDYWDPSSIKPLAFCGYAYLKSVKLSSRVTGIGEYAFAFTGVRSADFSGTSIKSIDEYAFKGCHDLKTVKLPSVIYSIKEDAFNNCTSLTSADLGGVVEIGTAAFYDCESLTSLTLGNRLHGISNMAFNGCKSLQEVTIPGSIVEIGKSAFANTSLASATLGRTEGWKLTKGSTTLTFSEKDNIGDPKNAARFLSKTERNLGYSDYEWIIDNNLSFSLTDNGKAYSVFYNGTGSEKNIIIPDIYKGKPVTSIEDSAFSRCSRLMSITIPDSVTSIGSYAFSGCSSLTSVTIPDSITSIGDSTFSGCSSLTSITIPDTVTSIGSRAFSGCSSLTSITVDERNQNYSSQRGILYNKSKTIIIHVPKLITGHVDIPDSVTSIWHNEFLNCDGLTSITIPDSVTSIGNKAFYNCSGLTSITIGKGVTSIGSYAFYGCSGLTSIAIPGSVTSIGSSAFERCSGLTSITIPDSVKSIESWAFLYCSGLTSVTVGKGVTSIGGSAFDGCSGLTSITVDERNQNYSSQRGILYNKSKTRVIHVPKLITGHVDIPNSVTSIGSSAFEWRSGLTSITIGNSVTSIGNKAFYNCRGLTSITIPDSVTSIGSSAFEYCRGLTSITFNGTKAQWNAVSKGIDWDYGTGKYTVTCTDGKLDKNGNVI